MNATLYGVGVGPGDPGLVTLAAWRILESVPVVFAPAARGAAGSLAARIVAEAGVDATRIVALDFPMSRDAAVLEEAWLRAAGRVVESLDAGNAAFVTLGDPSVYSTWTYLRTAVLRLRPDARCVTVPGIMAMNAAAARLETALVEGGESLALLPLPDPVEGLDRYRGLHDTLVIYKIGERLGELHAYLRSRNLLDDSGLVEGAGLERERAGNLEVLEAGATGYLSTAIVRTGRRS